MFITILFLRPIFSARFTNAFRRNAVKRGRNVGYRLVKRVIMQVRDRSILLRDKSLRRTKHKRKARQGVRTMARSSHPVHKPKKHLICRCFFDLAGVDGFEPPK